MKGETTASGLSAVAALLRQHDRDRFATALFAPAARQQPLFALYAFNYEIARVRETVTEPMLGRIRLQWWRENLDAAFAGGAVRRHVVAVPLAAAIHDFALTRAHFDRLVDSRERDLDREPPATLAALEDYAEGTSSCLVYLALEILGIREPAVLAVARDVGIAYALAGLVRAMPFHASVGHCVIPVEVAARAGLDARDYAARRPTDAVRAAIAEIAAAASARLRTARRQRAAVPRSALPALLPALVAAHALTRLRRTGYDPFDPGLAVADPLQSWRIAVGSLIGRF